MTDNVYDPKTPIAICLPLHEALGILLVYEKCESTHDIRSVEGVNYTYSAMSGLARILSEMGKVCNYEPWRDDAAGLRAVIDQITAGQ